MSDPMIQLGPDPSVVQHPDGTQTYTPGMKRRKLAAVLLGVALTAFGFWWQYEPIVLATLGNTSQSVVVAVIEYKPGQAERILDTRKAVSQAEDMTRNAIYTYRVRFKTGAGQEVTTVLNYGQVVRPIHSIGDTITVSYWPSDPDKIIDRNSIRTWAFGIFFVGCGLLILIPQYFIYRAADKPIVLDSIIEFEAAKQAEGKK